MIIDFHCHTFPEKISAKVVRKLGIVSKMQPQTNGSMSALLDSMKQNGVDYSVNQPVMTSKDQVVKINGGFIEQRESLFEKGIIAFGGLHPDFEDYKTELRRLKEAGILGIKLHPAYQGIDLDDIRMMRIIDASSELGLITLVHSGIDIGIYDHNYSSVEHTLHVIDQVHPEKFVLAHMGNWGCWEEVEKDLCGAPVWFDTACSMGPIPVNTETEGLPLRTHNLSDEDFVRISRKHGTSRILFATDSPWADQGSYIRQINEMSFTEKERQQIFSENAKALLGLK